MVPARLEFSCGHKVLSYEVEFAVTLSNINFSLNVISPIVRLICGVSLYLSPAIIMQLLGLIKVFD